METCQGCGKSFTDGTLLDVYVLAEGRNTLWKRCQECGLQQAKVLHRTGSAPGGGLVREPKPRRSDRELLGIDDTDLNLLERIVNSKFFREHFMFLLGAPSLFAGIGAFGATGGLFSLQNQDSQLRWLVGLIAGVATFGGAFFGLVQFADRYDSRSSRRAGDGRVQ